MLLLLDTDIFAYKATTSAETEIDMGGDIWSLTMDMNQARQTFRRGHRQGQRTARGK